MDNGRGRGKRIHSIYKWTGECNEEMSGVHWVYHLTEDVHQ